MLSRNSGRALPCPQIARCGGRIGAGAVALGAVTGVLAGAAPAVASAQPLLERGSEGLAVAEVQRALDVGSTGYFGRVTSRAVIAFQRRDGLLVDGIVGPVTWGALFGASDGSMPRRVEVDRRVALAPSRLQATRRRQPAPRIRSVSHGSASSSSGGYAIPAGIVQCESGGNYSAVNPTSGAGGAYQILPSTWRAYGGRGRPQDASPAEQGAVASRIYATQGPSAWTCAS
jgi:hypothetical protein